MRTRQIIAAGLVFAVSLAISGCVKSSGANDGKNLKLGLLTSLTGSASSGFKTTVLGVDARLAAYKNNKGKCAGRGFSVVEADDTSSPQGSLAATQKLIQQDKVYALLDASSFFYGATAFASGAGRATPVIGGAFDGASAWADTHDNMFPVLLLPDPAKTYATDGLYLKAVGGTRVAAIAYQIPSSQAALKTGIKSAEAAGLQKAYVNSTVPFGSTDVGAIVLGIIGSKADVVLMLIAPDTAFAVAAGLRQAGYKTKAVLSADGYGADLLESPPAIQAAQGVTFLVGYAPAELKSSPALAMARALRSQGVKSGTPAFDQTVGWLLADLFLHGLEKAGCNASQRQLIATLQNDKTWNAGGLYKDSFDFSKAYPDEVCGYYLRLKGKAFVPEPFTQPICGGVIG